ncbi:MAG: hypothetical protein HS132_01950 [Planctomycetia bacterium]|nr:hypothetical protein [Planctomycetia bacterium]
MGEEKNTTTQAQSSKKSATSQKFPDKKPQKEKSRSEALLKSVSIANPELSLAKKIDDILGEIGSKPIKSFEKKEQEKLLQSYEKLISKMVQEINNSRR